MKNYNGKVIFNPSGKAGEYSYWACNFYNGCSNGCEYCYLKKGGKNNMNKPILNKNCKSEFDALSIFKNEISENIDSLREHGLFFTFSSDPFLKETANLTFQAIDVCVFNKIPVKILTKNTSHLFFESYLLYTNQEAKNSKIAFGFTLTGRDDLEPNASSNRDRIEMMKLLYKKGFKVFVSIEPVIDIELSKYMISEIGGFCNLFKVGLLSDGEYKKKDLVDFIKWMDNGRTLPSPLKFYIKDEFLELSGINRNDLDENKFVKRDYNLFK